MAPTRSGIFKHLKFSKNYKFTGTNSVDSILGPCVNPEELFQIDPETGQISCIPKMAVKNKRIFDVLPTNMRQGGENFDGSDGGFGANMLNCFSGSNKCSTGRLGK